jgi:predicted nucleic acid-binding protein
VIVVDTNVIAYFWLPGEFTAQAEATLQRDSDWIVPYLWRSEFRNVLATYVRAKKLHTTDAQTIYLNAESMLRGREYAITGSAALNLAFQSHLPAYDCEFVALAEESGCNLVTSDKKIVKAFAQKATLLSDFGR